MANQQATIKVHVAAANHLEALALLGLKESGALISVNVLGGMNVRFQVDDDGKVIELARYRSVGRIMGEVNERKCAIVRSKVYL